MAADTEAVTFTVLYAVTMIAAFSGNMFLIYIVWKKPEVRSLTSFMFVNMAVADLLVTLVVMPYSIAYFYTNDKCDDRDMGVLAQAPQIPQNLLK